MGSTPTRKTSSTALSVPSRRAQAAPSIEIVAEGRYTCADVRRNFLRGHELVPPPRSNVPNLRPEVLLDLAVADMLVADARAKATREKYGRHVEAWLTWAQENEQCPLPADPAAVAGFLAGYLVERDEENRPKFDGSGGAVARVAVVTVEQRLAALNRLHELAGMPGPGADVRLRELMKALRRRYGTAPTRGKAALTFDLIERMLGTPVPASIDELRRQAIVALHQATGATPGQLARLTWNQLALDGAGANVELPPTRTGAAPTLVRIRAIREPGRGAVRLLAALRDQTATWPGPEVFKDRSGAKLSRQGVHKLLVARSAQDRQPTTAAGAREVRDRALLLVGFTIAQRRANLSALNWDEVTAMPGGSWRVYLARSKTDQEGNGENFGVPALEPDSLVADPARALADWRDLVATTLGFDPSSVRGIPVFCRIDKAGRLRRDGDSLARLSGAAINQIVQAYATAAGLQASLDAKGHPIARARHPFGAHSMRSGNVTTRNRLRLPISEGMTNTGHKSVQTFIEYDKPGQEADLQAGRNLFRALEYERRSVDQRTAVAPVPPRPPRRGPTTVDWG